MKEESWGGVNLLFGIVSVIENLNSEENQMIPDYKMLINEIVIILAIFFISSVVSCQASLASVQKVWNRMVVLSNTWIIFYTETLCLN